MSAALEGLVALITGGASGIGAATAKRFVREGARVVIFDVQAGPGNALAEELGRDVRFVAGDHSRADDNARAVAAAIESFASLDILYNNAATVHQGPIAEVDEAELRRQIDACMIGPYLMTQAALPALRLRCGANRAILFTGSVQSIIVRPGYTLYSMVKHGIAGLVGSLALELAKEGIRVNGLCPGPVDTPLFRAGVSRIAESPEAGIALRLAGVPLGRMIEADEIAAAALFLASRAAANITGVMLPVDGGICA
jgi:NAD(P)-dependent dehydrogenase (short-subunit alcohol dehydrogenase family)